MVDIFDRIRKDPHMTPRKRFEKWEYPVRIGVGEMDLPPVSCDKCGLTIEAGFALGHWDINAVWKVRHRICPGKAK